MSPPLPLCLVPYVPFRSHWVLLSPFASRWHHPVFPLAVPAGPPSSLSVLGCSRVLVAHTEHATTAVHPLCSLLPTAHSLTELGVMLDHEGCVDQWHDQWVGTEAVPTLPVSVTDTPVWVFTSTLQEEPPRFLHRPHSPPRLLFITLVRKGSHCHECCCGFHSFSSSESQHAKVLGSYISQ